MSGPPNRNNRKATPAQKRIAKAMRDNAFPVAFLPSDKNAPVMRVAPGGQRAMNGTKQAQDVFKAAIKRRNPRWPK